MLKRLRITLTMPVKKLLSNKVVHKAVDNFYENQQLSTDFKKFQTYPDFSDTTRARSYTGIDHSQLVDFK